MPFGDTPAFDLGIDRGVMMPVGELITSALSNKGNATGFGQENTFRVRDEQEVRIVDNKGNVLFSGFGPEAARQAVALGQDITDEKGNKAGWTIQTGDRYLNSDGSVGGTRYSDVANEKVNKSTLSTIGDVVGTVAPLALGFVPGFGQLSLLAKVAAAAGTGGLGAALKGDDILKGALLGGATAGIVSGTGLDKAIGGVLGSVSSGATQGVAKTAAEKAAEQIVVTALSKTAQGAGSALGQAALSEAGNALSRALSGYKTPAEQFAQQPLPEAFPPPVDMYAGLDPIDVISLSKLTQGAGNAIGNTLLSQAAASQIGALNQSNVDSGTDVNDGRVDPETGEIVVSKYRPINPPGGFDPIAFAAAAGLPIGSILDSLGPLNTLPSDPALMQPEPPPEDIVVNAPIAVTPETGLPVGSVLAGLGIPQVPTPDPALTEKGGVLGTGLNLPQLISIGGVGADLLKNLLAGGDGTGTGAPYVSPFGTGVGFAQGQDMRANPNITDYERYGFGPEAMFFRPEYSGLLSSAAPTPQAQPAMTINPVYQPLI